MRLFPRRKVGDRQAVAPEKGRLPVSFDLRTVGAFFSMPQAEAAQELGISLTALKQVCRKLGVVRWPYRRPKKRGSLSKDAAAGSCLHPVSGAPSLSAAAVHVTDDDADTFGVSVLRREQTDLSGRFAGMASDKWTGVQCRMGESGCPLIGPCLATFECAPFGVHEGGDHLIIVGRVLCFETADEGEPLVFFRGKYHQIASLAA